MSEIIQDDFLDPKKPGTQQSVADSILQAFRPSKDGKRVDKPTFFNVPIGPTLAKFRFPKNSGEIRATKVGIPEFVQRIQGWQKQIISKDPAAGALGEAYQNALSIREFDPDDLCNAYLVYFWSHPDQDGGKLSEAQCLTMVAWEPFTMSEVVNRIYSIFADYEGWTTFAGVVEKKDTSPPTITGTGTESD